MEELIFIKLGGSVVTDKSKPFTAREGVVDRLAREIKDARKKYSGELIIGHGAGSFAHVPAAKYKTKEGLSSRKDSLIGASITEEAARRLNGIVLKSFISQKLPVFPFSPASFLISDTKEYSKSYFDSIAKSLNIGIIPLVYGDVVMDKKQAFTIFSTEKVFDILVGFFRKFYKIRMIYVTDVDGVYDENGKTIPVISNANFDSLKTKIVGAKGVDVTGGMLHKVDAALKLGRDFGINTIIINGKRSGELRHAVLGLKTHSTLIA